MGGCQSGNGLVCKTNTYGFDSHLALEKDNMKLRLSKHAMDRIQGKYEMSLNDFKSNNTSGVRYRKDYDGRKYVLSSTGMLMVLEMDKQTVITVYPFYETQTKAKKLVKEIDVQIFWVEDCEPITL